MTLAFLGTGLLGSGFVEALLMRGETVRVWNRTRAKADALVARVASNVHDMHASVHDAPNEAAAGATRIHLCLSDDAAVDAVLDAIAPSLAPGAWVVDHTTTSPEGVRRRYARAKRDGFAFAHAPVFMSPAAARDGKGMMLLSGPEEAHAALRPLLAPMTGELVHLGPREDLAASFKLFGNAMLIVIASGLSDVFGMAHALAIEPELALSLFSKFNPSSTIQLRGPRMAKGDFEASFELAMARKDVGLMLAAAKGEPLAVLPAIAARMDALIARGHGKDDLGVLAVDAVRGSSPESAASRVLGRLRTSHRRIEERLADLEAAAARGDAQRIDDVIAFYERSIVVHEDDEERSLFPRLASIAEAAPIVAALGAEHRTQKALWDRLLSASRDAPADVPAIAAEIRASYARHLTTEERDLFPMIEPRLPEPEWSAMDAEMQARRRR